MTRTALITGGTSGLGRATAARFVADGTDVVITGRRVESVRAAAAELGARGIVCDATDPAAVGALARAIEGPVDVLVNTAGGNTDFDDTGDDTDGTDGLAALARSWRANLDANVLGAVLTTHALRDRLGAGASVISVGSIGAERGGGSYGAAKAALTAWNAALSAELGPRGTTANVISPGYIADTNFFRGRLSQQRYDRLIAETHDKRPGRPEDFAGLAFFLASPDARHITGQTLHLNGGAFTTR